MEMRKINIGGLLSMLFLLSFSKVIAQTEPMYSQYMFNMLNVNPAYAGSRSVPSLTSLFRKQWMGIRGAPQTSSISLDMPMNNDKIGIGIQLLDDRLGVERTTGAQLNYAYRAPVSNNGILAMGIRVGLLNYRANYSQLFTIRPNDPAYYQNVSGFLPAAGAGIYYMTDKFYVGASVPSLLQTKLNSDQQAEVKSKVSNLHFFATMGTVLKISDDLNLKHSVLMKSVSGAPIQFDFNSNLWLQDRIAIGFSYRTGDAIMGMLEYQLNEKLRFGYSYDYTISNLNPYNLGTHEAMIRYEFSKDKTNIQSTRYF
jgi:type IX secretion system PorP/SprF family membrane protein